MLHININSPCNTSHIRKGISSLPPACRRVLSNYCKTKKIKFYMLWSLWQNKQNYGMLKNTSMDRASMGILCPPRICAGECERFCFASNFSKKIDRCQETLHVWHLLFILKLKCHEVIMSLIRLSHTNEVECKSFARDRIRRVLELWSIKCMILMLLI